MSTPPPHGPSSGQPPQPPGHPPYPQQPPGHPPQGPPPGPPQYAPPPGAPPHAGPPQPPYGPGQPPYGPGPQQPYGQPPYGPPPQKQGMSTGAKVGIGVGSAVLVLALVVGVIVVLPLGDDESGSAAPETSATEETEEDTTEENEDDDTVPDPDAEVFTGSEEERIELDEPHSDPRIVALEAEEFASVTLLGPDDGVYASLGSNHGETNRVMYNYFDFMEHDDVVAIEVTGMGDWTVTLEPLSTAIPWTDPDQPLEGEGSEVYSIDWDVSGEDVAMEHDGESNFAIWAVNLDEGGFELLVNEIGTYEGSETLPPGSAFLDVAADGEWSLTVS